MWVCLKIGYLSTAYNHHCFPYKTLTKKNIWTFLNHMKSIKFRPYIYIYFTLGDGAFLCVTFHHKSWSPRVIHLELDHGRSWAWMGHWKVRKRLKLDIKTMKNPWISGTRYIPNPSLPRHPPIQAPRLSQPTPTWLQHQVFWLDDLQVCP